MPHRPVIKESSTSYKIRPVFDASARDAQGLSLNSCLEVGPNLLPDIVDMLLRFHLHETAIVSDIERAFMQILVSIQHRDFLRFFWKESDEMDLNAYRFTRLPFGVSSAPFLLSATIRHHALHYPMDHEIRQV